MYFLTFKWKMFFANKGRTREIICTLHHMCGRRGELMLSVLDPGSSGPGSGPGWGHCVVFLGKALYSHGASLLPGV